MSRSRSRPHAAAPAMAALLLASCAPAETVQVRLVAPDAIEFPAIVDAHAFGGGGEMSGYHLIVWQGGGAARHALLRARVSDVEVLEALETLGARPGDALAIDTWEHRHDPQAEAPTQTIAGPLVHVEVVLPGREEPLGLADLLEDPGGRGFEMRFGGHAENIPRWRSGCVVCLYSCPGGKVGNASYTVRDFVDGATHFRVRAGALPPDGTEIIVRLRLAAGPPA